MLAPRHKLPAVHLVRREEYLLEVCTGRNVLHLGCADWPHTAMRFQNGSLLHRRLLDVCRNLAGLDLSEEGVDFLARQGLHNVFCSHVDRLPELVSRIGWVPDVFLAGEIVEHLDNPGEFLDAVQASLPESAKLLITVPNAYSLRGFLHMLLGREKVNPDHVAYYSLMNVRQMLSRHHLELASLACYRAQTNSFFDRLFDLLAAPLLWFRPFLADGLIVQCCPASRWSAEFPASSTAQP